MDTRDLPIGVFDSGVGGLTVLRAIRAELPGENLLYLGDTARLPYGTKSGATVARYSLQATARLVERGVKLLVVACNTATAAALPELRQAYPHTAVLGVVEPGAQAAVQASCGGVIAVIGTESTIRQRAYHQAIFRLRPDFTVLGQACPLFVSLAEEGLMSGPIAEAVAAHYLDALFNRESSRPDTLVLGCTHFPPLAGAIRKVTGPEVAIVDSARTTARAVRERLATEGLLREPARPGALGDIRFMTTDDASRFARVGGLFMELSLAEEEVELVNL